MVPPVPTGVHLLRKGSWKPHTSCYLGLLLLGTSKAKRVYLGHNYFCCVCYKKMFFKNVRKRLFEGLRMLYWPYLLHGWPCPDQRNLGMSMRVERSTLDQVKKRFEVNKKKMEEKQKDYDFEERMKELREEVRLYYPSLLPPWALTFMLWVLGRLFSSFHSQPRRIVVSPQFLYVRGNIYCPCSGLMIWRK